MTVNHRWIILPSLFLISAILLQVDPVLNLSSNDIVIVNFVTAVFMIYSGLNVLQLPKRVNPPQRLGDDSPTSQPPSDGSVVKRIKLGDIIEPDTGNPLLVSDSEFRRHMVIVGQSGSGKTVCIENILWQQIRRGAGAMFIDGKLDGDTLVKMKRLCYAAGRIDDLLVINPDEPEMSHTYNPLLEGDVESVVSRIMSTYSTSGAVSGTSDHFMSMNKAGLTYVIGAIQSLGLAYTFEDLAIIMSSPTAMEELWKMMPRGQAKTDLSGYMEGMMTRDLRGQKVIDLKKFKDNLGGLAARMGTMAQGKIGEIMNVYNPQVRLFEAIMGNKIVYTMLPSLEKSTTTAKYLAQFMISDLQSTIARIQKLPADERPAMPYFLLFDEFGAYATYPATLIWEQARNAGICTCAAFQTFSSLTALGQDFLNKIMGNSMIKIFYSLRDQDSPDKASSLLGYVEDSVSEMGEHMVEEEDSEGKVVEVKKRFSKRASSNQKVGANVFRDLKIGEAVVSVVNDLYKIKGPLILGYESVNSGDEIHLSYQSKAFVKGLNFRKIWNRLLEKEFDMESTSTPEVQKETVNE